MTENKRFTYDAKQVAILKNGEFWLECAISTACNHSEICNELNNLVDENEQLKEQNRRLSEQKHIYKQDWKHLCIDKELLDSENEGLKEDNAILKHALSRIICEFDEHIAKNSEVRDLIK